MRDGNVPEGMEPHFEVKWICSNFPIHYDDLRVLEWQMIENCEDHQLRNLTEESDAGLARIR